MKTIFTFILASLLLLSSCITAHKINSITTGMTKEDVFLKIGRPSSTSSKENIEFLNYKFFETLNDWDSQYHTDYYVKLVNGRVNSFGRLGDFDSTKDPTININTNNKTQSSDMKPVESDTDKMYKELLIIKELFDKDILTKKEYEDRKKQILEKNY